MTAQYTRVNTAKLFTLLTPRNVSKSLISLIHSTLKRANTLKFHPKVSMFKGTKAHLITF